MKTGTKLANRYEIVRKIATGGMGELYLAEVKSDNNFVRQVVIKRLHTELHSKDIYKDFFIQEAVISGKFHHPNIVQVYDMGRDDDGLYMVMEYILGKDLMSLVRRSISKKSFIPLNHALNIILQIGEGLSYVHSLKNDKGKSLGMVHRDVTPQNIIITLNGFAKLVDFGVAAVKGTETSPGDGILPGKINYMAPELLKGKNPDRRADIFSLGVMLYELTVGKRLFKGNRAKVRDLIISGTFPVPTNIIKDFNPQLEQIILKSLENNPDYRYSNAEEMVHEIETFALKNSMAISRTSMAKYIKSLFVEDNSHTVAEDSFEHEDVDLDLDINFIEEWTEEGALGAELPDYDLNDLDDEKYFELMANPEKFAEFQKSSTKNEEDEFQDEPPEEDEELENSKENYEEEKSQEDEELENSEENYEEEKSQEEEVPNPENKDISNVDASKESVPSKKNKISKSKKTKDSNSDKSDKSEKTRKSKKTKKSTSLKAKDKSKNSKKIINKPSKDSTIAITPIIMVIIIISSIVLGAAVLHILS